jgi:hypothetical protein
MHRDRTGLEIIHSFFHNPEDLNSNNIISYEAPKIYRDYSITGTDGFKPLWNYEERILDVILNMMKAPCIAGNNARNIFPLALFYNKVNKHNVCKYGNIYIPLQENKTR